MKVNWTIVGLLTVAMGWAQVAAAPQPADKAVIAKLHEQFSLSEHNYSIELLTFPLQGEVDESSLQLTPLSTKPPIGLCSFNYSVISTAGTTLSGRIQVRIRHFVSAWVTKHSIKRHEKLEGACEFRRVEVTQLQEAPLTDPDGLRDCRSRRHYAQGQILTQAGIETLPHIIAGQTITLICTGGGVSVTTEAICLQDGRIGEMIKVKNKNSGKTITASVIDSRSVTVAL